MVRFIITMKLEKQISYMKIYIPIWLDLLSLQYPIIFGKNYNLHSNMVRFIIKKYLK